MKRFIIFFLLSQSLLLYAFPNREPQPTAIKSYIETRLSDLVFSDPSEKDLAPSRSGQVKYEPNSDTLGQLIKQNIGNILYIPNQTELQVEPLSTGEYWVSEDIKEEDSEILTWFVDRSAGLAVDIMGAAGVSANNETAAHITYRRIAQYKIKPEFNYILQAALYGLRNQLLAGLPGYTGILDYTNRWIIIGVVVNRIKAEEYTKWDFKGNVSGALVGVGGSLFYKTNQTGRASEWRSYYIVTSLEAAVRAGYSQALQDTTLDALLATLRPNNIEEGRRLAAFFNIVKPIDTAQVLSRLDRDPTFRAQVKNIHWENVPKNYNLSLALKYVPSTRLLDFNLTTIQPEIAPSLLNRPELIAPEVRPWLNTDNLRNLERMRSIIE